MSAARITWPVGRSHWSWLLAAVWVLIARADDADDRAAEVETVATAATATAAADWPMYHRDYAGTRYSPLTAIDRDNVARLDLAWVYRFNRADRPRITGPSAFEIYQQVTPIAVDGSMYLPAGDRVVALEPATGREFWTREVDAGLASFRGLAYWPGEDGIPPRIYFTSLKKLIALNAADGTRAADFGNNGEIDLEVAYSGVPTIYRDRIIIGANFFGPGEVHIGPQLTEPRGQNGNSRAYDAVTGEKVWEYNTLPQPGEPGHDTWGNESWRDRTGNNVWTFALTLDADAGLVYMPVSTPFNLRAEGTPPSLVFPSLTGGVNWGGVAIDPEQKLIFVNSKDEATTGWTIPNPQYNGDTSDTQVPYTRGNGPAFAAPGGPGSNARWPCHKPPWASLMAIDAEAGEIVWSVPLGDEGLYVFASP